MAAIDKIYGTNAEYDELKAFVYERRKSLLRYFYPRRLGYDRVEPRAICNMPTAADVWLYENCPLEWVRERIREMYAGRPG